MRTFYIFKINKEFKTLTKNKPYNLYLALNDIYKMDKKNIDIAGHIYYKICDINDIKKLSLRIFNYLKDSDYYMKYNNNHLINNYYTNESSKLTVKKSYLKLKSTINRPYFFRILRIIPNLFVVDFAYQDYFWLS